MKKWILILLAMVGVSYGDRQLSGVMFSVGSTNEAMVVLPLKKTEVKIDVTAGIARTEVVQRFKNEIDRPLEAVYIFPLPSDAAVEDFEIRLKDKVIKSTVKEKAEAKATYEEAKAEGKKAALLEQERPNIFTTSVANLLPGETVDICFSYVEAPRFRKDRYELTFPMVVGERYIPFEFNEQGEKVSEVEDADRLNPPVLHPNLDSGHRLKLEVRLNGLPVESVASSTHAIDIERGAGEQVDVRFTRGETVPNSEFNMTVKLRGSEAPSVTFVESGEQESYGLLSVFPPIGIKRKHKALPKDVVFLIDTSSSMSGESIAQAKSGLKRCLEILQEGDRFSIVRFSSEFSWFSPELREADEEKIEQAREYIHYLEATGGTEMQPALEYVFDILPQESGRMPLVIFLTDGDVGNESSLINLLARKLGNTRLFTFGIGSAPNEFLMHRMAEVGRGQSRFIRSHEDVGHVMSDFFQTLEAPVLTDVEIQWDGASVHTYPENCPDIFYGRPLQVVAKAPKGFKGQVIVTGMLDGEVQAYTIDLDQQQDALHPAVEKLYGRMQIKDLMIQMMQSDDVAGKDELKQSIIEVALRHQLLSPYTSRVAVEEKIVVGDGDLVSVNVPVPAPKGWTMYATASNETLHLLIGGLFLISALVFRRMFHAA